MLTQEQIDLRKNYLCGSDIGSILNINKYKSAVDVYLEKIGMKAQPDISSNPRVKFGSMAESIVTKYFEEATGITVHPSSKLDSKGWFVSNINPFMAANVDGLINASENDTYVFEAKTAGSTDGWGEQGEFIIPEHYLAQIAHYVSVVDAPGAYIAVLFTHTLEFRHYFYVRNHALESAIIEKERAFWHDHVLPQIPPPPVSADDVNSLCHYMTESTPIVVSGPLETELYNYACANKQLKIWQDMKDKSKDAIALHMGTSGTVLDGFGKVMCTYKFNKGVERLDGKLLKEEQPELYKKYTKISDPVRTINVKVKVED